LIRTTSIFSIGILTQYWPSVLDQHVRAGRPWDLDRELSGGIRLLPPYQKNAGFADWYHGTADAVYQNLDFIRHHKPDTVVVLLGDYIYKMDYGPLLHCHQQHAADVTICTHGTPPVNASGFGVPVTDDSGRVVEFQEKPRKPHSNAAFTGIYVFQTDALVQRLIQDAGLPDSTHDLCRDVLPSMLALGDRVYAYPFAGYWTGANTVQAYWEANMALLLSDPPLDLSVSHWVIRTRSEERAPAHIRPGGVVSNSLITDGCDIAGQVEHSVLSPGVRVGPGAVVRDSIVFCDCEIGSGAIVARAILDENVIVGENVQIGLGEECTLDRAYPIGQNTGITMVGIGAHLPAGELAVRRSL
jgi:glucose-1-phosphate adenylyltransferase